MSLSPISFRPSFLPGNVVYMRLVCIYTTYLLPRLRPNSPSLLDSILPTGGKPETLASKMKRTKERTHAADSRTTKRKGKLDNLSTRGLSVS